MKKIKVGDIIQYDGKEILYFLNKYNFSKVGIVKEIDDSKSTIIAWFFNKNEQQMMVQIFKENFDKIIKL